MATIPSIPEMPAAAIAVQRTTKPMLLHLQILRVTAASLVVVDHTCLSLNFSGAALDRYTDSAHLIGHIGVVAFFVVSGFIMMRQSAGKFGVSGSTLNFAWNRLIRIVPLYWFATLLRFASKLYWHSPTPHAIGQILLSLAFIPNFLAGNAQMQPILDVGWTLNYEMSFYLLFALCLFLPRKAGVALLIVVPIFVSLPRFQGMPPSPELHPISAIRSFYTDTIVRFFAFGVFVDVLERKFTRIRHVDFPVSPALLLGAAAIAILAFPVILGRPGFWVDAGTFAAIVAALCTMVTLDHPGWLNRTLVLLGDASYSTYLFHLWIVGWVAPNALLVYRHFHRTMTSPVATAIFCVLAANMIGLGIHLLVERPMSRALKRLPFNPQTVHAH